ncbi:FAD-binding protein [Puniceicoccales bacterium CK1056]|uniref:FAD-binding protein n=1 Tax=Oceanipulchritudo coccoides TaxID=2706888 RepID=A0A6B2LYV8_9BACT|nr:FAD-binding and (Fe-S)-binding domain-containing protein [Oceanipulchritudo coccoides]NDV61808.1 FAD-binding protein [Oceanipulchritudo coccoides]
MNGKANNLSKLASRLKGAFHTGELMRRLYATDASAYQEVPLAVSIPECEEDLVELVNFARTNRIGLIPRTAGTSLAGQVVGSGIVVDVSRHFTKILEINRKESWVRCQPGVIRNELNMALEPHRLLFGPETSTQNRAMMGGMLGNNSCGSNSIKYGSMRDHLLEVTALLADGSKVVFGPLSKKAFEAKCNGPESLETQIYRDIRGMLGDPENREEIRKEFPDPAIPRRNTGYALDLLMDTDCFDPESDKPFNFGKLIAGSEGTLCLVTEMKLRCLPMPEPVDGLLCAQFESVEQALLATQISVKYDCFAVELIDRYILDCTARSIEHRENRFFIEGDPGAVLVTEIRGQSEEAVKAITNEITEEMRQAGLGYAYPVLFGDDTVKIWNLRKAGLGLLSNMPGDAKPVPVVEDTAVRVSDLPAYIGEFNRRLKERFGLDCVHYAHAGSGEIHLRPIIDLKTEEGNRMFREVAQTIAELVKEYRGSLSGEHGDGRLRGEFLKQMIGEKNYALVEQVKQSWDPQGVFNPRKIVGTPPMNSSLRYAPGQETKEPKTLFDWSSTNGMLGAAEMCNGSGDCRKTHLSGGTMCPSYMATRNEKDTTRARANMLRHALTEGPRDAQTSVFDNPDVKEVLDLCLSCKGCKKECPSTVDMAKLKAEFMQHYYDAHRVPLRARMVATFPWSQKLASYAPWAWNALFGAAPIRRLLNKLVGFHPDRTIPLLPKSTFSFWFDKHVPHANAGKVGSVWFFNDEFTNFTDVHVGIKAVTLLERLGYAVEIPEHKYSGRTWLSKGLVRDAKMLINENLRLLGEKVTAEKPMVGVEPSGILTFVDEALDLAKTEYKEAARRMAPHCYMVEAFIAREAKAGRISPDAFTDEHHKVKLHGHCFQKALTGPKGSLEALRLPRNFTVELIPSGCCGMAGSFGYEKEHYALSQAVGELVLFPTVRRSAADTIIAAPGTSCRHQIHDGTGRTALHPIEVLHDALK